MLALICGRPMSNSVNDQAQWLEDYALFRALKVKFDGAYYLEWPAELVQRQAGGARPGST